jgi:hypothetical protein
MIRKCSVFKLSLLSGKVGSKGTNEQRTRPGIRPPSLAESQQLSLAESQPALNKCRERDVDQVESPYATDHNQATKLTKKPQESHLALLQGPAQWEQNGNPGMSG